MNAGPGSVQDSSLDKEKRTERGADYRLIQAAEGRVEKQDDGIDEQTDLLPEIQPPKEQSQYADQHADMETADGQNVRNTEIREGFVILGGDKRLHSEQQGGGITAGFLTEAFDQRFGKPVPQGSDKPGIGEEIRIPDHQFIISVYAEGDTLAEQGFPEVVSVRIDRAFRVVQ